MSSQQEWATVTKRDWRRGESAPAEIGPVTPANTRSGPTVAKPANSCGGRRLSVNAVRLDPEVVRQGCERIAVPQKGVIDKARSAELLALYKTIPSQTTSEALREKFWLIERVIYSPHSVFLSDQRTNCSRVTITDLSRKPKFAVNKYVPITNRISDVYLQKVLQEMRDCFDGSVPTDVAVAGFISSLQTRVTYHPTVGVFVEQLMDTAGKDSMVRGVKAHLSALTLAYQSAVADNLDMYEVNRLLTRLQGLVYVAFNCDAHNEVYDTLVALQLHEDALITLLKDIESFNLKLGRVFIKKCIATLLPDVVNARTRCILADKFNF